MKNIKKVVLISIIIVCLIISNSYALSNAKENVKVKIIQHTVSLFSEYTDGGFGSCTGVVLKNTPEESYVLTAKHCTSDKQAIYIGDIQGKYYIVGADKDLAIIYFSRHIKNKFPIQLASYVTVGQTIYHLGYPSGKEYYKLADVDTITTGNIYTKAISIPGCSGGGVFNEYGELVGILWGGNKEISATVSLRYIKKFLRNFDYLNLYN